MISRRDFIKNILAGTASLGASSLFLRSLPSFALTTRTNEDHFFLEILVRGGWDTHYLFDARPLAFTQSGIAHDYYGKEPFLWTGTNGGTTWASEIAKPLESLKDYFSIVNGVVMSDGPDGHAQVLNTWFAGNTLGGDSFIPYINKGNSGNKSILDCLQRNTLPPSLTNHDKVLNLKPKSSLQLNDKIKNSGGLDPHDKSFSFLEERYAGITDLSNAWKNVPTLKNTFSKIQLPPLLQNMTQVEEIEYMLGVAFQYFKEGLSRGALLMTSDVDDFFFDTHHEDTAKKHPTRMSNVVSLIVRIMNKLRETPYNSNKSFLDVTTVIISSEFSRSLRQNNTDINKTGTDHNSLNNSVLLAGKGIQNGLVIGASDLQTISEELSPAHIKLDPNKIKLMGRPFDYSTQSSTPNTNEEFKLENYISAATLVNTLLDVFNVDQKYKRSVGNINNFPSLKSLIKT